VKSHCLLLTVSQVISVTLNLSEMRLWKRSPLDMKFPTRRPPPFPIDSTFKQPTLIKSNIVTYRGVLAACTSHHYGHSTGKTWNQESKGLYDLPPSKSPKLQAPSPVQNFSANTITPSYAVIVPKPSLSPARVVSRRTFNAELILTSNVWEPGSKYF
jgi:hypothetical protein